jgi:hypothetical protein
MVELVDELKKLPQNVDTQFMIQEAQAGEYHDYKNNKYACGKMASADYLAQISKIHPDCKDQALKIRSDIVSGVYDEKADDEDITRMSNVINSDENMTGNQKEKLKKVIGLKDNVTNGPWGKFLK